MGLIFGKREARPPSALTARERWILFGGMALLLAGVATLKWREKRDASEQASAASLAEKP